MRILSFKNNIILLLIVASLPQDVFSGNVRGHFTKRGKYVSPHKRSNPNKTKIDNWSTKGNVNPYTGKVGNKPTQQVHNKNIKD